MRRSEMTRIVLALCLILLLVSANPANAQTPLWVQHVKNFPGGISNGVRAHLDPAVARARSRIAASPSPAQPTLNNLQMNDDPTPDLPQNETQVVLNPSDPMN